VQELSQADGRRIAVAAQGFGQPRAAGPPAPDDLIAAVGRLGLVQLDTVNVLCRSHYFGFRYHVEIYAPAATRVHGYYVLPFLLGDALVARVDLKSDRRAHTLIVQAAYAEPDVDRAAVARELAAELSELAGWLGLGQGGWASARSRSTTTATWPETSRKYFLERTVTVSPVRVLSNGHATAAAWPAAITRLGRKDAKGCGSSAGTRSSTRPRPPGRSRSRGRGRSPGGPAESTTTPSRRPVCNCPARVVSSWKRYSVVLI
jgi:Winged helix DNA-binding domain